MPRGDGTGPNGTGPMTGRGLGKCVTNQKPTGTGLGACGNGVPRGRGIGTGRGMNNGFRRCLGLRRNP